MKITIEEMVGMTNVIRNVESKAYEKGVSDERERELPKNFFEALLQYAGKTKTLVDYHRSGGKADSCNWIQIKPTREGSDGIKCVEISFEENLTEINYVGVTEDENP
jgi:hypothetical protein